MVALRVEDLVASTSPSVADLLYLVTNPGGTPVDSKITLGDLATFVGRGEAIDVRTLGMVLDGITDNLTALNAALTAGFTNLFVPSTGVLLLSSAPHLPAGTRIHGQRAGISTIKMADGSNPAIIYSKTSDISLRYLVFDGGTQTTPTNSVLMDGVDRFDITYCTFRNMKVAVWFNDGAGVCKNADVSHNIVEACKDVAFWGSGRTDASCYVGHNTVESVTAGSGGGPSPTAGILWNGNGTMEENVVLASADTGVCLVGINSTCAIVRYNHCYTTLVSYFIGSGATGFKALGNEGVSASDFGMHLKDGQVTPNYIASGIVAFNHLHDCGKSGMVVEGMTGLAVGLNVIQRVGLTIGAGVGPAANQRSGLVVDNSFPGATAAHNVALVGNIINDEGGPGFMEVGILRANGANVAMGVNSVTGAFGSNYAAGAPAVAPGAQAGAGATTPVVVGVDLAGHVELNTGTGATPGNLATVTFTKPFDVKSPPIGVMLTNGNGGAAGVTSLYTILTTSGGAVTGFTIVGNAPSSTNFHWYFQVITIEGSM